MNNLSVSIDVNDAEDLTQTFPDLEQRLQVHSSYPIAVHERSSRLSGKTLFINVFSDLHTGRTKIQRQTDLTDKLMIEIHDIVTNGVAITSC